MQIPIFSLAVAILVDATVKLLLAIANLSKKGFSSQMLLKLAWQLPGAICMSYETVGMFQSIGHMNCHH